METKKLIKILLNDMSELEELIATVKANGRFKALEMEFIHTRAKGILQLVQLIDLNDEYFQPGDTGKLDTDSVVSGISVFEEPEEKTEQLPETVSETEQEQEQKQEQIEVQTEEAEQKVTPREEEQTTTMGSFSISVTEEEKPESETEAVLSDEADAKDDEDMLEEEVESAEVVHRLGETFTKGKSLNELTPEKNKLEFKLSNLPVSSLQAAIGINDRFQYIRELFDGDNQKYLDAVKNIDSLDNLKDAVDYLRDNFKWKKNETSLKFVRLVKRRFSDE